MDHKKEIQKELEELSPLLSKIEKGNSFKVPSGYFDDLSDNIMEQVKEAPVATPVSRVPSILDQLANALNNLLQPRVAIGLATVALLLVSTFYFADFSGSNTNEFASLSDDEVTEYFMQNISAFEEDLLIEIGYSFTADDISTQSLDNSELENYFLEMNDNIYIESFEELL